MIKRVIFVEKYNRRNLERATAIISIMNQMKIRNKMVISDKITLTGVFKDRDQYETFKVIMAMIGVGIHHELSRK